MKLSTLFQRFHVRPAAKANGPAVPIVPPDIKEAIDRVATFVTEWEEDFFGEPFAAKTRVARSASALVAWAFQNDPDAKLHFYRLLQNGPVGERQKLDRGPLGTRLPHETPKPPQPDDDERLF